MRITLEPIGLVRNDFPQGEKPPTWQRTSSRIEFAPQWTEALSGLDGFSHAIVLCYLHLTEGRVSPTRIHPQGRPTMPLVGFFGTRTPARPNPISCTVVQLVKREGHILFVDNLDMYDGTPVLDIKPYITRGDCHPEAQEPDWIHQLRALQDVELANL
jgi:tRNA-Thr(GGU) m(6)t(6)A37 methyltransferase TsaA